jgi:hypothetical protein
MKVLSNIILLLAMLAPESLLAATLHIHVVDETGHAVWARLEVRGANEKEYQPATAIRDLTAGHHRALPYYLGSFVIQGECEVDVPPGRYRVIGEHGLEYTRIEKSVAVGAAGPTRVTLQLRPWIRMWKQGWWSGDFHVHRPPADAQKLILAEDLNFCPIITQWPHRKNMEALSDDVWGPGASPLIAVDQHHFISLRNGEDERGGGAWIFLSLHGLLEGLDTAGGWNPSGIDIVKQAFAQRSPSHSLPWVDCENTEWWEVPVAMALATPDSIEVLGNHFMQYGLDDVTDWGRPPGKHEANDRWSWLQYTLGLYYRYLNLGFRLPPSAGSASGAHPNPVGYNRVYVHFSGPFTVEKWFAALREGKGFITNGPMLFFDMNSAGPVVHHVASGLSPAANEAHADLKVGATTLNDGPVARANVEAHAREPIDRIELVANGEVIQWAPVPPGTLDYKAEFTFDSQDYTWVAARCFLRTADTIRLAHSSPVFLPGHRDCRPDAKYFVDWVNDLINETKTRKLPSAADREHLLDLYGQALAFYTQKFQQGCSPN